MSLFDAQEMLELEKKFRTEDNHREVMQTIKEWEQLRSSVIEFRKPTVPRYFADIAPNSEITRRQQFEIAECPAHPEDVNLLNQVLEKLFIAEELAIKFANSLLPWNAVMPDAIVWHFVDKPFRHVRYLGKPFDFARDTVSESLSNQGIEVPKLCDKELKNIIDSAAPNDIPRLLIKTLEADVAWHVAVDREISISGPRYAIRKEKWASFADLENPFRILISLWQLSCFVYEIPDADDPTLRIFMIR